MEQIGIGVYTRQLVQGLERSSLVESRQLKQNIGVVGIFVKQNIKLIDSFARATERLKRHRFVITSAAIFGVGVKLFVEGLCRFFKAIETEIGHPQIEVDFGVLGGSFKHLLKCVDGFLKPELGLINDRQPFEDLRLLGIARRRFLIDALRSRIVLPLLEFPGLLEIAVQALRNRHDPTIPGNDKHAERNILELEPNCRSMRAGPEHSKK